MDRFDDFFHVRTRDAIRLLIADRWYAALGSILQRKKQFPMLALAAGVLLVTAVVCLWGGTWWRMLVPMARPEWNDLPADLRAQAEGQFRLFAVQATAAIGGVVALAYTARNYRLSRRGQITDRLVKALERLGSAEEYIRLGGVLALEQIANDAPDQAQHIVQILHAFVRRHAPRAVFRKSSDHEDVEAPSPEPSGLPDEPASDVQAALTLMTRSFLARRPRLVPAEMEAYEGIPGALDLSGLHLQGVNLSGAWLKGAKLDNADLAGSRLDSANLSHASLSDAQLQHASLEKTNLTNAWLSSADLEHSNLEGANCTKASFVSANLTWTKLRGADLTNAFLYEANLDKADLNKTDLTRCVFTVEQITVANLTESTRIPAHLADDPRIREVIAADQAAKAALRKRLGLAETPDASVINSLRPPHGEDPA